jgi:hypothetical protein
MMYVFYTNFFFIVNSYVEVLNLICFFLNYLKLAESFGQPRHNQPPIFQKEKNK